MALARRPEGAAGDDRDVLLLEQACGERFRVEARRRDPREGVEGAPRLERLEADRVEAVDDEPAPAWRSAAASRTSRASGPIWSSELAKATIP